MKGELETYLTGTLAGAGSFRCRECGYAVALNALDQVPQCPSCLNHRFARASIFDTAAAEAAHAPDHEAAEAGWLDTVRAEQPEPGHYLAYREAERISVMPLMRELTRIGRSLTADIRFDDPTVSRRHALIVRQEGEVRVLDDRSLNGVFLRGERVEWGKLEDRDELIIGRYKLYFFDTAGAPAPGPPERQPAIVAV
jgi:FHA domain-containing protein/zinc ribbon family protein